MIDYRMAREEFERYLDGYDRENDKVKLKIVHTYGVVAQSTEITKRMGLPEEIAAAVVYFASDDAAYTTGQILAVSGGFGLATPVFGDLADKANARG